MRCFWKGGVMMDILADTRVLQETLNYWKQLPHILKYFRAEEDPNARRPQNFMSGFLEVCFFLLHLVLMTNISPGSQLNALSSFHSPVHIPMNLDQTPQFSLPRRRAMRHYFPRNYQFMTPSEQHNLLWQS
jgi:hypothetical protein